MKSRLLGPGVSRVVRARRIVAAVACLMCVQGAFAEVIDSQVWPENGHTYHLLELATWSDSEAEAVALGGHLATINDQAEQDWIWNTFGNYTRYRHEKH